MSPVDPDTSMTHWGMTVRDRRVPTRCGTSVHVWRLPASQHDHDCIVLDETRLFIVLSPGNHVNDTAQRLAGTNTHGG